MEGGAKDQNIQALRGLAAMLVVTLHACFVLIDRGYSSVIGGLPPLGTMFGAMGVDLFFVISGAMMAMAIERDPKPGAFLIARLCRVVPLFWLAAALSIGVKIFTHDAPRLPELLNSLTILPIFDRGLYDPPVPAVGWTLAYELYLYLIVGLALLLPSRVRADAIAAVLLCSAALGALFRPLTPMAGIAFNPILLEFLLGFWALRTARTRVVRRYGLYLAALGGIVLTLGVVTGYDYSTFPQSVVAGESGMDRVVHWGGPSALIVIGVMGRSWAERPASALSRLGDASYSLYLVHPALFALVAWVWPWWSALGCYALVVTVMVMAPLASISVHERVEQPLLRHMRKGRKLSPPPRSFGPPIGSEA